MVKIIEEGRLMQQAGAILGVIPLHDLGQGLGAPQPAAQGYELGQFLIVQLFHGVLDVGERAIQLPAHPGPIFLIGKLDDRMAARHDRLADSQGLGKFEHGAADLLHLLGILGFHGDKSLGNDIAEQESGLRTHGGNRRRHGAENVVPVGRPDLVEYAEDFAGHRHDHILDHHRLLREFAHIDMLLRLLAHGGRSAVNGQNGGKKGER